MRSFAISDVHGCLKTLEVLLFNTLRVTSADRLFFLGDYIDRGPDSKGVLDLMMAIKSEYSNTIILRGNHEQLMLAARHDNEAFALWMKNSGAVTLNSFGIKVNKRSRMMEEIPFKYFDFLETTGYYQSYKNLILLHAGLDLSRKNPMKHLEPMIWITEMVENNLFLQGRVLIHGHRCYSLKHLRKVLHENNSWHYSIDSGCVYDYPGMGYLTALEMESMEMTSVKRIDEVKK